MLTLFGGTIQQPLSNAGGILPAGYFRFYATGTVDPKDVFHDADGAEPWIDPTPLDGNGRAIIFLDDDGAYDIELYDANDALIWTLEKVIAAAPAV